MMQPYEELEYILWNLLQRVLVGWLNTQLCHQRHFGTARHSHYLIRIAIISITGWAVLVPLMMHHRINAFQILRNRQLPPTNWCFKCAGPPSLLLFHPFPVTQLWFPISTSSPGHKCRGEPGNSKFAFSAVVVIVSPVFGECTSPRVCVESYGRGEGWPSFHFAQTHTVESIQLRCSSSSWAVPAALLSWSPGASQLHSNTSCSSRSVPLSSPPHPPSSCNRCQALHSTMGLPVWLCVICARCNARTRCI